MVVNIVDLLHDLGFSEYEARAYTALVEASPATAYETAHRAGIPTSKIYEVLARLVEKDCVLELRENEKKRFVPMDPDDFVASYRSRVHSTLKDLSSLLAGLRSKTELSSIWNIRDNAALVEKAKQIIETAESTILLSCWKEELIPVLPDLKKKEAEGLPVAVVHFGKPDETAGMIYPHPIEDTLYAEKGGRGFTLVADGREALVGTVFPQGKVEGAWSRNRGFVTLAEDYIKHDIYIMKIVARFNDELIRKFGVNYAKLRDIFHDEEA